MAGCLALYSMGTFPQGGDGEEKHTLKLPKECA